MTMIDDFKLLEKNKFKLLPYGLAKSEEEAIAIAKKIGYPVALKIISPEIVHKTDVGGVRLNIKNEEVLRLTYKELTEAAKNKKLEGILIQKMARKGLELIIGGVYDEQFGHMIILGFGGVYVEVFKDITARICPINKYDVIEMVRELKSHPIIMGTRGKKAINIQGLEELMIKVCRFMQKENVAEMDLNPVIFDEKGYDIVDVRFRLME
ncbi:MAG: acetate--CoA ligase family protein [Candidatus Bilamarchaeaceae archaeon]